jgi:hypothetical protein
MTTDAIVDVWDEPNHHRLFRNEYVSVVRARLAPGATSLFHRHTTHGIAFAAATYTTENQLLDQAEWTRRQSEPGRVAASPPRVHRIRNAGMSEVVIVDAEIHGRALAAPPPAAAGSELAHVAQVPGARGYTLELAPGETSARLGFGRCLLVACVDLVVALDDRPDAVLALPAASAVWLPAPDARVANVGEARLLAGVIELL